MKTKHTQGEWNFMKPTKHPVSKKDMCLIKGWRPNGLPDIIGIAYGQNVEEAECNAKLIAAAPDLLEALYAAKLSLKELAKTAYEYTSLAAQIETAIKKATE